MRSQPYKCSTVGVLVQSLQMFSPDCPITPIDIVYEFTEDCAGHVIITIEEDNHDR